MKLINLYNKSADICYKSPLCSSATLFVIALTLLTIISPFIIIYNLNTNIFEGIIQVYEQPRVQFTYKYLFLGENINAEGEDSLISSSSFLLFNQYTEEFQESISLKYTGLDYNNDGYANKISFELSYDLPANSTFKCFSFVLYLEAHIQSQCSMVIPAAIIMNKKTAGNIDFGGELQYSGDLKVKQAVSLQCPYFMRKLKTRFNQKYLNDNTSALNDFQLAKIIENLDNNPAHFYFDETMNMWKKTNDHRVVIKIHLKINEENFRYRQTIWNKLKELWMEYLSLLIIFMLISEKMKWFIFTKQILKTWETFPFLNKKFN